MIQRSSNEGVHDKRAEAGNEFGRLLAGSPVRWYCLTDVAHYAPGSRGLAGVFALKDAYHNDSRRVEMTVVTTECVFSLAPTRARDAAKSGRAAEKAVLSYNLSRGSGLVEFRFRAGGAATREPAQFEKAQA